MRSIAGWSSRGYLPHYDDGMSLQCVTYRLADALPSEVVVRLAEASANGCISEEVVERSLATGHGSCLLRFPENARIVLENWRHFEGGDYHLHDWVVMPNHVHVLIEPTGRRPLRSIVQSWKSYTAKRILQRAGRDDITLWEPDYWDRFIRSGEHRRAVIEYIRLNPVRAGLCNRPDDWPWSSAHENGSAQREAG